MLFGSRLFGERPRQHELGLEYGVEIVDEPVQGRRQVPVDRVPDPALNVRYGLPSVAFVPNPVQRPPSWTIRLSLRSSGSASPRFSFQSRISAASSGLMMIRASDPPMNWRRPSRIFSLHCVFKDFLLQKISVIILPRDPIQGRVARGGFDWSIAGLAPAASVKTPSIDLRHRASRLGTVERLRSVMEGRWIGLYPRNRRWGWRPAARAWIEEENKKLEERTPKPMSESVQSNPMRRNNTLNWYRYIANA
jgi:hypothetical protein